MCGNIYIYTNIQTHTYILDNKSVGLFLPLKDKHFKLDL